MPRPYTKKAAPVAVKTTRRKPGPKPKAVQQEASPAKAQAAEVPSDVNGKAITNFGEQLAKAMEAAENAHRTPDLTNIEIIDLRGVNIFGRFHVANFLQNAGYIFAEAPETAATDYTFAWMSVDAIRLSHGNKLMFPTCWDAIKNSKAIVKLLAASANVFVDFSEPLPDQVEILGEKFARQ
jgi:hypothetical protein